VKTQKSLKITMLCDGMPFHGDTLKTESLGGTETAALQTAQEFNNQGHKVTILTNTDKVGDYGGVEYRNVREFNKYFLEEHHDVSLVLRHPSLFKLPHNSKINILWQHDLAFINDKDSFLENIWNIDSVWCQSDFHKNQYQSVMGLPKDFYWEAGSAIDPELIPKEEIEREDKKLVYSARPERGLEVLVTEIMPRLLKEYERRYKTNNKVFTSPKLYITTYDNFPPVTLKLIERIKEKSKDIKDNIVWLPPLTKIELYKLFKSAYLYVYPVVDYEESIGFFEETYCLSIDECMACGLPFISRPLGAIPETLNKDAGVLVDSKLGNELDFYDNFANEIINLLRDKAKWKRMSKAGEETILKEDIWRVRVKKFTNKIYGLLKNKKENKLSICVLVREEDKNNLTRCLNNIENLNAEMVVGIDDKVKDARGSIGSSHYILKKDMTESEKWNCLTKKATGNWILWLYGSEILNGDIRKYINNDIYDGFTLNKTINSKFPEYVTDEMIDCPARLFNKKDFVGFQGEFYSRPLFNKEIDKFRIKDCNIIDLHKGDSFIDYCLEKHRKLSNGCFISNKAYFLMKDYYLLILDEYKNNGFIVSGNIKENCKYIIDIYKNKFIGDLSNLGIEALRMYSEANRILNKGFEFNLQLDVSKGSKNNKTALNIRFNDRKEADLYIKKIMDNQINPLMSRYFLNK